MNTARIFTSSHLNENKPNGQWAEHKIENFIGGFHVFFIGIVTSDNNTAPIGGLEGEMFGNADSGNSNNEIQISVNEKGLKRDFFFVRQDHVEACKKEAGKTLELTVRYQVQDDGYIEVRTFEPCSVQIAT